VPALPLQLSLTLAAADPGPGQHPADAGLANVEEQPRTSAGLVLAQSLLEALSAAHVVAGVAEGP